VFYLSSCFVTIARFTDTERKIVIVTLVYYPHDYMHSAVYSQIDTECPSVRLSVCRDPVLYRNGLICRRNFFTAS